MEDIFFSGTPLLEAVGLHEPFVEELRETVRNAILKSLIPVKAYAQQYDGYLPIMNLDISNYIKYDTVSKFQFT
jgi:dynein heavy chain